MKTCFKTLKWKCQKQKGTINAENLIKAYAMLESQQAHGKIVLVGF